MISPKSSEIHCSVCLDDDIESNNLCLTDCHHQFCKKCLDEWFDQGKQSCPMCRKDIKYFEHDNEKNRIIKINSENNLEDDNNRLNLIRIIGNQKLKLKIYKFMNYTLIFYNIFLAVKNNILIDKIHEYHDEYTDCMDNFTDIKGINDNLVNENNQLINTCDYDYSDKHFINLDMFDSHGNHHICLIPEYFINKCIAN